MKHLVKYDVSISVSTADNQIARQIAAELKRLKVKYYYYEEHDDDWGEYIIKLTADSYGRSARYVLLITSQAFKDAYWGNIERQTALAYPLEGEIHILQLRLDDTIIDGISKHAVYRYWNNNPEEIAAVIKKKVVKQKKNELLKTVKKNSLSIIAASFCIVMAYFFLKHHTKRNYSAIAPRKIEKKLITGYIYPSSTGIDSFYISNVEITAAQYRAYCNSVNKPFPPQPSGFIDNLPVVNISWYDAQEYCHSQNGRLPSESEWEYAAKARCESKYSGGNNASKVAVYKKVKPNPPGSKDSNQFNLYDMTGNVSEWCSDWIDSSHIYKVVRGGSYNSKTSELLITHRAKEKPTAATPYIGFRIVWDKK